MGVGHFEQPGTGLSPAAPPLKKRRRQLSGQSSEVSFTPSALQPGSPQVRPGGGPICLCSTSSRSVRRELQYVVDRFPIERVVLFANERSNRGFRYRNSSSAGRLREVGIGLVA